MRMRDRSASDCRVPESTSRAGTGRLRANDHVAAADERRRLRLFEHDAGDAEEDGHHRDADTETRGEHGAADRVRGERSQREPSDHRVASLSIRPSRIVSTRVRAIGQRGIVRDDDERGAVGVDAIEERRDLFAGRFVELAGRLVGEQQPRAVGERARDRDALHLAAGELRRPMVGAGGEADVLEQLASFAAAVRACDTPASDCGSSTFSAAVSIGSRKNRWKTKPICRSRSRLRCASDSRETSWPSKSSVPDEGASTQPSMCSSVDLPQPDGPRIAM